VFADGLAANDESSRNEKEKKDITFPPTHTRTHVVILVHTGGINNSLAVGAYIWVRIYIIICVHIYYVLFPAETACRTGKFDVPTPLRLSPCLCVGVRLPVCACDECCSNGVLLIRRGLRAHKYLRTQTAQTRDIYNDQSQEQKKRSDNNDDDDDDDDTRATNYYFWTLKPQTLCKVRYYIFTIILLIFWLKIDTAVSRRPVNQ